jgi:hypothetical protein
MIVFYINDFPHDNYKYGNGEKISRLCLANIML